MAHSICTCNGDKLQESTLHLRCEMIEERKGRRCLKSQYFKVEHGFALSRYKKSIKSIEHT